MLRGIEFRSPEHADMVSTMLKRYVLCLGVWCWVLGLGVGFGVGFGFWCWVGVLSDYSVLKMVVSVWKVVL